MLFIRLTQRSAPTQIPKYVIHVETSLCTQPIVRQTGQQSIKLNHEDYIVTTHDFYPQGAQCRVGVEPRATRVYIRVHEDCEMAKTTPPKIYV